MERKPISEITNSLPNHEVFKFAHFLKYMILKYAELYDFVACLKRNDGIIFPILNKIMQEIKDDQKSLEEKLFFNPTFSEFNFYVESLSPGQRVNAFHFIFGEFLSEYFNGNNQDFYEHKRVLDTVYEEYKSSLALKANDEDLLTALLKENKKVNLNKFHFLFENDVSYLGHAVVVGARTGVGKTVFSAGLIEDVVKSNNNVAVLYFGTAEVNKRKFHKRLMAMFSNEETNKLFEENSQMQDKKRELESIIEIFEMDQKQSLHYLKNSFNVRKYHNIFDEIDGLDFKVKSLEERIEQLMENNAQFVFNKDIEKSLQDQKSNISSLQLKKKENYKTIMNYLKADEPILRIIRAIFKKLSKDESFKETLLSSKAKIANKDFNEVYDKYQEKRYVLDNNQDLNISSVSEAIVNIEDFLNFLLKDGVEFYNKDLLSSIKEMFQEYLKALDASIKENKNILKIESDKVLDFLSKENVEIEDNLNIKFIENRIKRTREKFPEHKIVFIIDYHQKVEGLSEDRSTSSEKLGALVNDFAEVYNAFGVVLSQLNDIKASEGSLKYNTRPKEIKLRNGDGMAQGVGSNAIIINRNLFNYPENAELPIESVDRSFVIYEIYLSKNRYKLEGYNDTRQYLIFDKKKMSYLPVARKWYKYLDKEKELLYLDQFLHYIKNVTGDTVELADIVE